MSESAKLDNNQFWIIDGASQMKSQCTAEEYFYKFKEQREHIEMF